MTRTPLPTEALYRRARQVVAPLVNEACGAVIGKLMRGGVLYSERNFERWARRGFYVVSSKPLSSAA